MVRSHTKNRTLTATVAKEFQYIGLKRSLLIVGDEAAISC